MRHNEQAWLTSKNLITNAIKFTRLEEIREISVSLGISLKQPTHSFSVPFTRTSEASEAATLQADWEKGEIVSCCEEVVSGLSLT
jgi:hypothetical protein